MGTHGSHRRRIKHLYMKNTLTYISILAGILCSCSLEENILPDITQQEPTPLELMLNTAHPTKGLIKESRLPDPSMVGITVRDPYGAYTGEGYTNVKYTSRDDNGAQVWESDSPVMLSTQSGTVYSYYPYADGITDITSIPVRANSTVQTDFLWGTPVSASRDNRTASIILNHALAAVKISFARGTYSGTGNVTNVTFGGDCIATVGYLDATDGSLSNLIGKGVSIEPPFTATTLSSTPKETEILVIPTGDPKGKIVITIDGEEFTLEFNDIALNQGEITQFYLTVNDGELSLSDITVSEWTYGDSKNTEVKVTDKVTLTGEIDDIAFYNNVSNGTVTIVAVPKTKDIFEEVEPVTYTGTATLSQVSDIETGVRTITITDIESDVTVTFAGTYTYDLVTEWEVTAGEATQMIYNYYYQSNFSKILRIREGDKDIPVAFTNTFSTSGTKTLKYSFTDKTVPGSIFEKCPALCGVRVSNTVTGIGGYAFSKTSIRHFELPATVISYGSGVLYDCLELESVILPDNLTEIYDSMFRGCESLTVIDIPDGVTKLGDFAFDGCASLASIIIPAGVTYVGNYCFSDCSNLRHIVSWPVITPNLGGNYRYNFLGVAKGGVLAVPAAAKTGSNYSYWVSSGINLGSYGWTLVYMDE